MSAIQNRRPELRERLSRLEPRQRVIYAIDCADHALPHYVTWTNQDKSAIAEPEYLTDLIHMLWKAVEQPDYDLSVFTAARTKIEQITPSSEDLLQTHNAINAAAAIASAVECLLEGGNNVESAVWAGLSALFAADMADDVDFSALSVDEAVSFHEKRISDMSYPLAREWKRQIDLLDKLQQMSI